MAIRMWTGVLILAVATVCCAVEEGLTEGLTEGVAEGVAEGGTGGKAGLTLEAIGAIGVGDTAYEISARELGSSIRSRLEFPLDGVYVGADACFNTGGRVMGVQNISFGAKFLANVTDPSEDMNDFDWVNGMLVGDTASEAESSSYMIDIYMKGDMVCQRQIVISGVIGLRHEEYAFDVYGFEGYYLPPIGNGPVSLDSDTLALTYEMTHDWIYGGIEGQLIMTDSLIAEGSVVIGFGAVEDRDDHVLRSKISTGELVSVSSKIAAHLIWYLAPPSAGCRPYLKAGVEALTMVAEGEQDQEFEDEDLAFYGIDDEIELTFVTGNAMLGCTF